MLVQIADELPLPHRRFRPATEGNTGQVHRVEVVSAERIGTDTIAACRGTDQPGWHYEIITPLALVVGQRGIVRNEGFYRKLLPRWIFAPEESHEPGTPDLAPDARDDESLPGGDLPGLPRPD